MVELIPGAMLPPSVFEDAEALEDLFVRGTPPNTQRAYARDMRYISAWKQEAFGADLVWPETEATALRFILDHARDLSDAPPGERGRRTAEALIAAGLRRSLACPAPSTLDRRIASWRALHRMRGLDSPFSAPLVKETRSKARRAAARPVTPKSANPLIRDVLEEMLATCKQDLRGLRDRAVLMLGWGSGGRRRSEIAALDVTDLDRRDYAETGAIRLRLKRTKTTSEAEPAKLVLKGRAAKAVMDWLSASGVDEGALFRRISKAGARHGNGLTATGVALIVKTRLKAAGYPPEFASAHGLRSGFLTQAALDGAPLQAAMRLSLHKSAAQAQRYYADVDLKDNPAADLLG